MNLGNRHVTVWALVEGGRRKKNTRGEKGGPALLGEHWEKG